MERITECERKYSQTGKEALALTCSRLEAYPSATTKQ